MNYKKCYDSIISRSKNRKLEGYKERHHVIPRCMNGTNDISNIVELTAREHYVCHQLLIKIYPKNLGLVNAANMMCSSSQSHNNNRMNNRLYEWLRRRLSKTQSERQAGESNINYGKKWYVNYNTSETILSSTQPTGNSWMLGRSFSLCTNCKVGVKPHWKYCISCRPNDTSAATQARRKVSDDDIIKAVQSSKNRKQVLEKLNFQNWSRVKNIMIKHNISFN